MKHRCCVATPWRVAEDIVDRPHLPPLVGLTPPDASPLTPQRGLQQLQNTFGSQGQNGPDKPRAYSLMVQGLRTSPADPDAHVLFFDIESLIGEPTGASGRGAC